MTAFLDMPMARRYAESLMTSTCTITRDGAEPVWNEATGTYTTPAGAVIYTGICKVQNNSRAVNEVLAGERRAAVDVLELHLPIVGSESVRRGDRARIDSNPADLALVGREFIVQAEQSGSIKTARRLPAEAVS